MVRNLEIRIWNVKVMKSQFKIKNLIVEYSALVIMVTYMIIYLLTFYELEHRAVAYHVISFGVDAYIPFCEYFVIPYFLWFPYVAFSVVTLCLFDKEEAWKLVTFLIAGMTVFLIISAVFPNGHHLRPKTFERDNIFVMMVKRLYRIDTSTNVVPSIHVYNTIGVMIACYRTKLLKNRKLIKLLLYLLGVSIILSTVFLKQHSMLDVMCGGILSAAFYSFSFKTSIQKVSTASEHVK